VKGQGNEWRRSGCIICSNVCAPSTKVYLQHIWYEAQVKQWAYLRSPDQADIPKVGATSDTGVTVVSSADEATSLCVQQQIRAR